MVDIIDWKSIFKIISSYLLFLTLTLTIKYNIPTIDFLGNRVLSIYVMLIFIAENSKTTNLVLSNFYLLCS